MYHKANLFGDTEMKNRILSTKDPARCKGFGRLVTGFNEEVWNRECKDIVIKGCYLKFSRNPILKEYLKSTGDRLLVEASPYDKIWGIGMSEAEAKKVPMKEWKGKNYLGECLMVVREMI